MLILNRKEGESIKIGDEIEIEVISVSGSNVKIGIKAPREVSIFRKELYDSIISENINASKINLEKMSELKSALQYLEEDLNKKK
ncbi:MAG: carbon storage regulator CsrA [bacterium]|nr:carbon storage regulator CsrA [Deltaproteobacteria bacterium]